WNGVSQAARALLLGFRRRRNEASGFEHGSCPGLWLGLRLGRGQAHGFKNALRCRFLFGRRDVLWCGRRRKPRLCRGLLGVCVAGEEAPAGRRGRRAAAAEDVVGERAGRPCARRRRLVGALASEEETKGVLGAARRRRLLAVRLLLALASVEKGAEQVAHRLGSKGLAGSRGFGSLVQREGGGSLEI
ncbi:unnamed protein product, partial [Pelagomonas calceolata]